MDEAKALPGVSIGVADTLQGRLPALVLRSPANACPSVFRGCRVTLILAVRGLWAGWSARSHGTRIPLDAHGNCRAEAVGGADE